MENKLWGYVLEVQQFIPQVDDTQNGKFKHVGYMNKIFKSKQEACDYYDNMHQHMRSLNQHNTWTSDCDPQNDNLRFRVRDFRGEILTLEPF